MIMSAEKEKIIMFQNRSMRGLAFIVLLVTSWMPGFVSAQKNQLIKHTDFKVYVLADRYGENALSFFKKNNFISATLLTRSNIDPKKTGKVDESVLTDFVNRTYPDKDKPGVCLIDWEEPFKEIKAHYRSPAIYKPIEEEYLKVISIIKTLRPKVEVSIYGIPFIAFSRKSPVLEVNKDGFFDNLLSHCDAITPSVYLRYTDGEVGRKRNIAYLRENINIAMEYGVRLNKKVIPYFWYRIHPMNKKYGLKLISESAMAAYMDNLINYSYNGRRLSGIIWYEGNIPHTLKMNRPELKKELEHRDNTISKYLEPLY